MAVMYQPPEPAICLECGGKIPYKNIRLSNGGRPCSCPHCITIGPGPQPMWRLDEANHVCQSPPNKRAIATAKKRLAANPMIRHLKKWAKKREERSKK